VLCIALQLASCAPNAHIGLPDKSRNKFVTKVKVHQELINYHPTKSDVGFSLCPTCINFADEALDTLLNIILQVGVLGSCGDICGILQQKTGSQILGVACNLLCDYVGITEFIKIIDEADLDPIWYCEILKLCPIKDNGDASITSFTVTPAKGPQGTTFVTAMDYSTVNGTGTGEIVIEIQTVDGVPLGDGFLVLPQNPGKYEEKISIKAEPNPDCDPTQQECENWLPGNYNVKIAICNGECGSKHPHSKVYDTASTQFVITN
jgi:hypothetical protein